MGSSARSEVIGQVIYANSLTLRLFPVPDIPARRRKGLVFSARKYGLLLMDISSNDTALVDKLYELVLEFR